MVRNYKLVNLIPNTVAQRSSMNVRQSLYARANSLIKNHKQNLTMFQTYCPEVHLLQRTSHKFITVMPFNISDIGENKLPFNSVNLSKHATITNTNMKPNRINRTIMLTVDQS